MIWKTVGYYTILYLAALQGIPRQLYEAATVDGATTRQQFFKSLCLCFHQPHLHAHHPIRDEQIQRLVAYTDHDRRGAGNFHLYHRLLHLTMQRLRIAHGICCQHGMVLLVIIMIFTIIRFRTEKKARLLRGRMMKTSYQPTENYRAHVLPRNSC